MDKKVVALTKVPPRALDLTGCISGRLRVTGIHSKVTWKAGGQVFMWHAECECGNKTVINGQHFNNGNIQSCGCLGKDRAAASKRTNKTKPQVHKGRIPDPVDLNIVQLMKRQYVDFRGRKVGLLSPLHPTKGVQYMVHNNKTGRLNRKLVVHWLCQCDCGMTVERSSSYLSRSGTIHGCQRCCKKRLRKDQPAVTTDA